MLDPRRLRLLIQLQSLGTVRAVAHAAALSPSAVSQQLAALERESGTALIERHGRSVALTDAGVALAGHARVILERIDVAEEALRALKDAPEGTVRVSAFTSAMRAFVIDAAAEVARQHPGIAVQLAELEPAENVPALERGDVDLAIVADFGDGSLPPTPHLRSVPLTRDELLAVLPLDTPLHGARRPARRQLAARRHRARAARDPPLPPRRVSSRASRAGSSATKRCSTPFSAASA